MPTLRELRNASGKRMEEVASDLGLGYSTLYRLETGKSSLRHVVAVAFADYYGVPVDQITVNGHVPTTPVEEGTK